MTFVWNKSDEVGVNDCMSHKCMDNSQITPILLAWREGLTDKQMDDGQKVITIAQPGHSSGELINPTTINIGKVNFNFRSDYVI